MTDGSHAQKMEYRGVEAHREQKHTKIGKTIFFNAETFMVSASLMSNNNLMITGQFTVESTFTQVLFSMQELYLTY